jgi:GTP-binding protein EngB required for normal cell division
MATPFISLIWGLTQLYIYVNGYAIHLVDMGSYGYDRYKDKKKCSAGRFVDRCFKYNVYTVN